MNTHLKKLCQIFVFFVLLFLLSCNQQKTIYVSPSGDDNNPGSKDKPVASIQKARDLSREYRSNNPGGDKITIFLMEGIYPIIETLEFGPEDSLITYQTYQNDTVIISGGVELNPSDFVPLDNERIKDRIIDENAREEILKINLKKYGLSDFGEFKQHGFSTAILPTPLELFIDNEPMTIARWPNKGVAPIPEVVKTGSVPMKNDYSGEGGIIKYDYDRAKYWYEPDKIWAWGFFGRGYADDNIRIKSIDTVAKTIEFATPSGFGIQKSDTADEWAGLIIGYNLYNVLEEIDTPGEYYLDKENGMLYVYPTEDFQNTRISVSLMENPLLAIENTNNLTFNGITFECGRGMGVYLEGGDNVQFKGCTFRNFGTIAVMMGKGIGGTDTPIHEFTAELVPRRVGNLKAHQYENTGFSNNAGTNHAFISCNMYNLGAGAMVLSGGDRQTLVPGNNLVENCDFYKYNRHNKTYCPAITLWGVGNSIRHSYIHDAPHQAIGLFGNDHLIEYNHIQEVVKYTNDMGAICIGRNPSERGNIIRYNFFDDLGTKGFKNYAIMLDDGASDVLIEGNVFYKTSRRNVGNITFNGGNDHVVRNNIFIKGSHTIWIENLLLSRTPEAIHTMYSKEGVWGKRMFEDVNIESEAWKEKYPGFYPWEEDGTPEFLKRLEFYNNVAVKEDLFAGRHELDSTAFMVFENNYFTDKDPGFINMEEKNFKLKENSIVFDKIPGFEPPPLEKMGLYRDEFRTDL